MKPNYLRLVLLLLATMLVGCAVKNDLMGQSEWVLQSLNGSEVKETYTVTLQFAENGRVSGFAGCNRFGGVASVRGQALTLSKLFSTRKACPQAQMELERDYLRALEQVAQYERSEGRLVLSDDAGVLLVFSAGPQ